MKIYSFAVLFVAIVSGSVLGLHQSHAAEQPKWHRNFDQARTEAKSSNKDLFIVLTGHGWCLNCDVLDQEVFQQAEFTEATKNQFVLVELDENFGDSPEEKAREKKHRELKRAFLSRAVPTTILADSEGRPYTIITGYDHQGPAAFLESVDNALKVKHKRDQSFSAAESKSGADRIRELHSGLQAVSPKLGTLEEREDDPILVFYRSVVRQILDSVDSESAPIRQHYIERAETRDKYIASRTVLAELAPYRSAKDYVGAIRHIERLLPAVKEPAVQWELESSKQTFLEWNGQHEKALENARRLLRSNSMSEQDREYLLGRVAYNLFNLKRFEEACAHYDHRISAAKDDPKKQLGLIGWKSQMVAGHGTPRQRISVHDEYRRASDRGSEHWLTATAFLADAYSKLGKRDLELKLLNESIAQKSSPWIMLRLIDCHLAMGNVTEAEQTINALIHEISPLQNSERKAEQDQFAYFREQIEQRRATVNASTD